MCNVNDRQQAEKELRELQLENIYLREEVKTGLKFEDIVGESDAIHKVLDAVEQVATSDSTVLITGETGTGKELIARAIHNLSARRGKLLVNVNCAALPVGLIESELFGHEKGAFTGALARQIGRFELADGGTIFLDEIGDLPLALQAKILRVLQEGEFERVGGSKTLKVDVRVIAATNQDLEQAMEQQRFRPDLYYRVNVFPIRMPCLRERREDIPLLARHFAMMYSARMGKKIDEIPPSVLQALSAYDWPGNIRELQNVMERAVIISRGTSLEIGEWPPKAIVANGAPRILTLEELAREHIIDVLKSTGWRVSGENGAAKILGMKSTTLQARMTKFGIRRPDRQIPTFREASNITSIEQGTRRGERTGHVRFQPPSTNSEEIQMILAAGIKLAHTGTVLGRGRNHCCPAPVILGTSLRGRGLDSAERG